MAFATKLEAKRSSWTTYELICEEKKDLVQKVDTLSPRHVVIVLPTNAAIPQKYQYQH